MINVYQNALNTVINAWLTVFGYDILHVVLAILLFKYVVVIFNRLRRI